MFFPRMQGSPIRHLCTRIILWKILVFQDRGRGGGRNKLLIDQLDGRVSLTLPFLEFIVEEIRKKYNKSFGKCSIKSCFKKIWKPVLRGLNAFWKY